jgi:hypothetical protein
VPGLGAVRDGQVFSNINRSVDFFVPPRKGVRLLVTARECDLPRMDPCAATPELSDGNDHPGDHADEFASAAAAIGRHVLKPDGDAYEVTYRVARVPGVAPGPTPPGGTGSPGSSPPPGKPQGCSDVHAPRSEFAEDDPVEVSDERLELRGTASDRGCGVARVELAIARHRDDDRCQYMRQDGRLRHSVRCGESSWVRATGTRHWKLVVERSLPEGTYTAHVRAIDRAGNVELSRDSVRFRLG